MITVIREKWAPVFDQKTVATTMFEPILSKHATKLDFRNIPPPSASDYINLAWRCKNSKPGPDGIPYLAWGVAGTSAGDTLAHIALHMAAGYRLPMHLRPFQDSC